MRNQSRAVIAALTLSVTFCCVTVGWAQTRPILGGYKVVATDNPEVVAAAEFAVGEQGEKQESTISLVSIERAESQVVAGINYRLCLKVSTESEEEPQDVKVVVHRNLQKQYSLTSWEEESCGGSDSEGNHASGFGRYSHAFSLSDPEATFQGARVIHNVTVGGQKGMRIHAKFGVKYGLDVPCQMIAYFYDEDGTPLEAGDDKFTTKQGKVSAYTRFTPQYDPAVYNDLQIFIPYEALNLESGDKYNLKFYLALYDQDGQRFFGKSGWYKFYVTMP
jgi:hypothetical protein